MDVPLGTRTLEQVHAEIAQLGGWDGARGEAPDVAYAEPPTLGEGQALLATWHMMLDLGRCQDGERFLAGTAQRPVARLSAATAAGLGIGTGDAVTVRTERGQVTLPLVVTPMPDGVVWVPTNSTGSTVRPTLGARAGDVVTVMKAAHDLAREADAPSNGEQL